MCSHDNHLYAVAVHGGSGHYSRNQFSQQERQAYRTGLERALRAAEAVLKTGGAALDAVQSAVAALEDDALFNAGCGAVLNAGGIAELDAAIMDGTTLKAGAVAGMKTTRNPVRAARAVMEHSPHVFLHGSDADAFASRQGLTQVNNAYFVTVARELQLAEAQARGETFSISKFGTVGAVARDRLGNIAAATSTGGMTNKLPGRVSDSAVIGAGVYASRHGCAVAGSGHGEFFIRLAVGKDISGRIEYGHQTLADAANHVIHTSLASLGGEGGVIAIDARGTIVIAMNTAGMFRGVLKESGEPETGIYADEALSRSPASL